MRCAGCGCTEERACPGGCHWISVNPPICSACDDGFDISGPFSADECFVEAADGTRTPTTHAQLWTSNTEGYCARCGVGFTT